MSSTQMAIVAERCTPLPPGYQAAAVAGCLGALLLLRLPISVSLRLVAFGHRRTARRARTHQAEMVIGAVRAVSRILPVRFACLETALASTLTCLLLRHRVDWCIGARMMPYTAHSWIEVEGAPIAEPGFDAHPYLVLIRT
ncbi:lasso peptide biosynthesis B2 protein [Nocardiopsis sp. CA-288880]|uniref:lasso peptide biosynthesis B2 protein n=1 Tax=Nocardiopsis sp. CA-288880 TaxID=3239995 RepID=UPI003D954418